MQMMELFGPTIEKVSSDVDEILVPAVSDAVAYADRMGLGFV